MTDQENITNLLPRREVIIEREKRHVSVHQERVRLEHLGGRASHATMGVAATPAPAPDAFLRKGRGDALQGAVRDANHARAAGVQRRVCQRRPSLPPAIRYPPRERSKCVGVDWVTKNVVRAMESSSSTQQQQQRRRGGPTTTAVHEKGGDTQDLLSSGLRPNYVFKKEFGAIPSYIRRRRRVLMQEEQEQREQERPDSRSEEDVKDDKDFSLLTEEERQQLLQGLRDNLKEAQRCLQCLPVVCETRVAAARRRELEGTVGELDRYIFLLENYEVAVAS